jgi:hypothetical protein
MFYNIGPCSVKYFIAVSVAIAIMFTTNPESLAGDKHSNLLGPFVG